MTTLHAQPENVNCFHCWTRHTGRDIALDAFKVIAFALMVFDHVAAYTSAPDVWRLPGRFVLPMFAVALAHKFTRYSSGNAIARLLSWGLVAQLALLPAGKDQLNILFTLGLGLLIASQQGKRVIVAFGALLAFLTAELYFGRHLIEYGTPGVLLVVYACYAQRERLIWLLVPFMAYLGNFGGINGLAACLGVLISVLYIYREQCFAWVQLVPTNVWYLLYPLHILVIWGITRL